MPSTFTAEDFSETKPAAQFTADDFVEKKFSASDFEDQKPPLDFAKETESLKPIMPDSSLFGEGEAIKNPSPALSKIEQMVQDRDVAATRIATELNERADEAERINEAFSTRGISDPIRRAQLETDRQDALKSIGVAALKDEGISDVLTKPIVNAPRVSKQDLLTLGFSEASASIAAGMQQGIVGAVEFLTSPLGVATLGSATLPKATQQLIASTFMVDMARHSPAQFAEIGDALGAGDKERAARAITEGFTTLYFVKKSAEHGLPKIANIDVLASRAKPLHFKDIEIQAIQGGDPIRQSTTTAPETRVVDKLVEQAAANPDAKLTLSELEKSLEKPAEVAPPTINSPDINSKLIVEPVKESLPPETKVEVWTPEKLIAGATVQRTGKDMRVILPNGETNLVPGTSSKSKALAATADFLQKRAAQSEKQTPAKPPETPAAKEPLASDLFPDLKGKAPTLERVRRAIIEAESDLKTKREAVLSEDVTLDSPLYDIADLAQRRVDKLRELGGRLEQETIQKPQESKAVSERPTLLEYAKSKLPKATADKITSESQVQSYRAQWKKDYPTEKPKLESEKGQGDLPEGTISGKPLTPLPSVKSVAPKAISQIIRDLSKAVETPVRFGRLTTRKFGGYFKQVGNLIGAKKPNDIQIVSHEVGHRLDQMFDLRKEKAFAAELMNLGDNTRPGSRSSWTPSKTIGYRKGEGVAEFIRYWLTDAAEATKLAPSLAKHFDTILKQYPDLESQLVQARGDIMNWRTAEPQARLMSNVSVGENPNKTRYTAKDLTRDVLDDLHYLRLAVDDVRELGGGKLPASQNPYLLARILRGSYGAAENFIKYGTVDFKTRAVTKGGSFEDILKPVSKQLDDFRAYIISRQAREMRAQGKETGLVAADVDFVYDKFKGNAEFNKAFDDLKAWSDSFIKYSVDAGYLSPEAAAKMRIMNQEYVPMHRIFEVGAGEFGTETGGGGRGLNQVGSAFKGRHGSKRDIVDPLETYIKNAYSIILNAEKNAVNISLADLAGKPGFGKFVEKIATPKEHVGVSVEKIREELENAGADLTGVPDDLILTMWKDSAIAPRGENIIKVNRGGKLEFYRLSPELYKTMGALDHESASMLSKFVSVPAQILRAGVTLTPDFAISNATRDTFSSAIISRHGTFPVVHTLRGIYSLLKNPQLVAEWKASGGAQSVEAHYYDRASMQKFLQEKISKDFSYADYIKFVATSPLKALRILSGTLEEATRIGEYDRVYKKLTKDGMAEGDARRQAGFESRDLQDFAMGGAKTKSLRRATAFFNAALQGNYRLYQALKDPATRYKTVLKGMAWVTVPTVTLFAINKDDEDYWDRPQWERDLFWLVPRGKDDFGHTQFLRVPKPFEIGLIFGTVPERAMAKWFKEDPKAFDGLAAQFVNQTVPNPVPQALLTAAEVSAGPEGYSWFRHRAIVSQSLERMPADMQFTEQTSVTARRIGQAMNVSPMKVDYAIGGLGGTLAKTATHQGTDRVLEWLTDDERTARTTYPGARFVATPAGTQSQAIENFYKELDKVRKEHARNKKPGVKLKWEPKQKTLEDAADKLSDLRKEQRAATTDSERQRIALEMREVADTALK